ncbi:MAG: hypothetical protein H7Z14_00905 [Anaerolineae bacterium]|nr:hypothetical protein [Phycisphaerae bacterium]
MAPFPATFIGLVISIVSPQLTTPSAWRQKFDAAHGLAADEGLKHSLARVD